MISEFRFYGQLSPRDTCSQIVGSITTLTVLLISPQLARGLEGPKAPSDLKCEYLSNPLGIDVLQPRFIWVPNHSERAEMQTAYQVLVASTLDLLNRDQGDQWDSSKTASTELTQMYHEVYGLRTVGLNISNCYGPRERAVLEANTLRPGEGRKMMATFIEAAINNDPLPVMGDGEQSSDFVFIGDVAHACQMALTDAAVGRIIEIGTGINTSVRQVAETIIELTGSKSKIEYRPMRTGEVKIHTISDTAEARKYLGWEWKTTLREGLRQTIPWYAKQLGLELPRDFAA